MDISAKITGIKYTPFLCRKLHTFNLKDFEKALSKEATFILDVNKKNKIAVSWWVSAKRTRSYPYARVYDSLSFTGKKVTIIPIVKDEGKEGDRDFLQWDTISLMSLLGIYVIVSYYNDAKVSSRYENKITMQRFDIAHIKDNIKDLLSYQSDPLHWNLSQIDKVGEIGQMAIEAYDRISKKLNVAMHSKSSAQKRINELKKEKTVFMDLSRKLAKRAQSRECTTIQPKEKLDGTKATLTIKNYLGGYYCFTSDEVNIKKSNIYLIEGKHTKYDKLPALDDIKDGLIKMILFINLKEVEIDGINYVPVPILKLTMKGTFKAETLNKSQKEVLKLLKHEAKINRFKILINDEHITV
ncbi:MAG: hypothetical protein FJZ11_00630 [Candidatus Omnitrophica bacterium]|nr:hypothetical protein [Candidatus Omnitrophota bacterium]